MDSRRPQLDWQTLQQVRWLLGGVLSLLAAWTVFYMEVDALVLLGLTTLAVPLVTWRPAIAAAVPGWIHRLAFPVVVALFAFDFYQYREPLPVMIRLGLMLLLYRSVTLRGRREDLQLILLALFLVVVAGVLTVSLVFVVQILLFTACALALMLTITLSAACEDDGKPAETGKPSWVKVDWALVRRRVIAVADWRVLSLAAGLFAGVVGLSALLFLLIPRFELGTTFFLEQMLSGKSKTGFSDSIRFGDVVDIQNDTGLALSVDVSDPSQVPVNPYWRMLVLDDYIDGSFMISPGLRSQMTSPEGKVSQHNGGLSVPKEGVVWTFYLEGGVSRYLPLLGPYGRVSFATPQSLQVYRAEGLLSLVKDPAKMTAYRVEGMQPDARIEDPALVSRLREREAEIEANGGIAPTPFDGVYEEMPRRPPTYLDLNVSPDDMARLKAWVAEIGPPKDGDCEGFANRACAWLERRHDYSMTLALPPGENDQLVRWMDSPTPGHCELFAGSLVLLCRAANVPARVVIGFKGGSWNESSRSITVTNADAHAWCEVFDGKRHWLRADPTPGAGGVGAPPAPSPATQASAQAGPRLQSDQGWNARWNSMRVFWYRRIVSFDQTSQLELVRSAGLLAESYGKRFLQALDQRIRDAGEWLSAPWSAGRMLVLTLATALLGGSVWAWRKLDVAAWWRVLRGADPVRREAGRWLRRFQARGVAEDDAVRADLLRLRYGRRATWSPSAAVFRAARNLLRRR